MRSRMRMIFRAAAFSPGCSADGDPCLALLPLTLMPKIIVTMTILVPVGGFALIGIGGDSLTRWLKAWINWRKHRRMIFYRGEVRL